MGMPKAKLGDTVVGICSGHVPPIPMSGTVMGGSKTLISNSPGAKMGDTVLANCGHSGTIISGDPKVLLENVPAAQIGSSVVGTFNGTIISGSPKVL